MCKLIEDMKREAREEGREEGAFTTLLSLVRDGVLSLKDAALRAGIPESSFIE